MVHHLRDVLGAVALFVLVQLREEDVQFIARSSSDQVDTAVIAQAFGGGGHDRASAAFMPQHQLSQVRQQLLTLLPEAIKPMTTVAQLMSHGVRTLSPTDTIAEAAVIMRRFGYEGYPVVEPSQQRLVGLLTRRAVDRAVTHEMEGLPVRRIMTAGSVTVTPRDSVEQVQQLMLSEGWGQIPVVQEAGGPLIGIVTRTDVLNHLFEPPPETAVPDMRQLLADSLSPALWGMVLTASTAAAELGMPLYFVGGIVRDLLLGKTSLDLDMVVEGNAIPLAHALCDQYGGDIHTHHRFGTAKWSVPTAVWQALVPQADVSDVPDTIDFVTARTEFYTAPTALPQVEQGSIKLDLHRRDFTINTLAVRLDGVYLGQLLDFYGGYRDLRRGRIRVLHSLSFIDDPTRILRAARFEQRLGFEIEPRTEELIANALPMLKRITGSRIRHELELTLRERNPNPVMARLAALGVWTQLHPQLGWSATIAQQLTEAQHFLQAPNWGTAYPDETPAFLYFALWLLAHPAEVVPIVVKRLQARKSTKVDIQAAQQALTFLEALPSSPRPSQVEQGLRPFSARALLLVRIILNGQAAGTWVDRYYQEWQYIKPSLTGNDLRQMGLKPGPQFRVWLDQLRAAYLDGRIEDEAGERALLESLIKES